MGSRALGPSLDGTAHRPLLGRPRSWVRRRRRRRPRRRGRRGGIPAPRGLERATDVMVTITVFWKTSSSRPPVSGAAGAIEDLHDLIAGRALHVTLGTRGAANVGERRPLPRPASAHAVSARAFSTSAIRVSASSRPQDMRSMPGFIRRRPAPRAREKWSTSRTGADQRLTAEAGVASDATVRRRITEGHARRRRRDRERRPWRPRVGLSTRPAVLGSPAGRGSGPSRRRSDGAAARPACVRWPTSVQADVERLEPAPDQEARRADRGSRPKVIMRRWTSVIVRRSATTTPARTSSARSGIWSPSARRRPRRRQGLTVYGVAKVLSTTSVAPASCARRSVPGDR